MAETLTLSIIDYPKRTEQANTTVRNYVLIAMGAGAALAAIPVPITPWLDLGALTAINLKMLYGLTEDYDIPFSKDLGKETISSLLAGVVPAGGTIPLAKGLIKLIPGIGVWASIGSSTLLSGAATYAVGKVFIQHFEAGGTILTFNPAKVREYFMAEFEKGKQVVTDIKQNKG